MKYFTPGQMPSLKLTLERGWFDMILSGHKREEYRQIKDYWVRRLCYFDEEVFDDPYEYHELISFMREAGETDCRYYMDHYGIKMLPFEVVEFTNGYGDHRPRFSIKIKSIEVRYGNPFLGAPELKRCFVICLEGEPFDLRNIDKSK